MLEFSTLLQQGNAWLFIPSAILLGVLHGLEPGHSKTMMAAFIVAVKGTVTQAIILGLAATVSHTVIVWIIALLGLYWGNHFNTEQTEPYLQMLSGVMMLIIGLWMIIRTYQQKSACLGHEHDLKNSQVKLIDTHHGVIRVSIVNSHFRLFFDQQAKDFWPIDRINAQIESERGQESLLSFVQKEGFIESVQEIGGAHQFILRLKLWHHDHAHDYDVEFTEGQHEGHHHAIQDYETLDVVAPGYQDPHELAHANDIRKRFAHRQVSTGQILWFGLTGGLIPCPASITVLLLCLQLKKVGLGAILVLSFSVGLALTMVASGVLAAWSVKHLSHHIGGLGEISKKAPYLSGVMILGVGLYALYSGFIGL